MPTQFALTFDAVPVTWPVQLEVLGDVRGKEVDPVDLQRAFGQRYSQRMTDARGFFRIGRWRIYVEESLPRAPILLWPLTSLAHMADQL